VTLAAWRQWRNRWRHRHQRGGMFFYNNARALCAQPASGSGDGVMAGVLAAV
jgi:hypothetical protein